MSLGERLEGSREATGPGESGTGNQFEKKHFLGVVLQLDCVK